MAKEHSVAESGRTVIPINEKYMLTIKKHQSEKDAASGGGHLGRFAVYSGNRHFKIRTKFEKFIEESSAV